MKKYSIGIIVVIILILGGYIVWSQGDEVSQRENEEVFSKESQEVLVENASSTVIEAPKTLKLGIITDTQIHPSRLDKSDDSPSAERYIKPRYGDAIDSFVSRMKNFSPDGIIVPGDIIEGTGDEDYVGIMGLQLVKEKLSSVNVPIYWAIGNHELRSVTREQFKEALQVEKLNTWYDLDGWRVITMDSNFMAPDGDPVTPASDRYIRGYIPAHILDFLKTALDTQKNTIVIVHHPPVAAEDGVPNKEAGGLLFNGAEVQRILSENGADIVVSGHLERKHYFEKDGVEYFVLPGTIKSKKYKGAYYEMELSGEDTMMTMWYKGEDGGQYISIDFMMEKEESVQ